MSRIAASAGKPKGFRVLEKSFTKRRLISWIISWIIMTWWVPLPTTYTYIIYTYIHIYIFTYIHIYYIRYAFVIRNVSLYTAFQSCQFQGGLHFTHKTWGWTWHEMTLFSDWIPAKVWAKWASSAKLLLKICHPSTCAQILGCRGQCEEPMVLSIRKVQYGTMSKQPKWIKMMIWWWWYDSCTFMCVAQNAIVCRFSFVAS